MDQVYDVIIVGTGLKECILSGLLSVAGKKVLHMDRNSYYGGETASLNLQQLYAKFRGLNEAPDESALGRNRDYCVDLCPKFIMACGNLVKILLHSKVTRYLEFKVIAGSYVYKDGQLHKVPATATEALATSLMGFMQKRRFKSFLNMVASYKPDDPSTHGGKDAARTTTSDLFEYWKLDENTQTFTGHAMALHQTDDYLQQPALPTLEKIQTYAYSVSRYGSSPYIYPMYGLGGLPEGFSRLAAIHGGTYMLNKPVERIVYAPDGKFVGVESEGEVAKAPILIGDPSYFVGDDARVRKTGVQIVRWIFLLTHPIPGTNDADSVQIIIPFKQTGRRHDIYISCVSHHHAVSAQGKYIATISTVVETPNPKKELSGAAQLLGSSIAEFFHITDMYEPVLDGKDDNVYITKSFDSASHFEAATNEVLALYERITGTKLDMTISADPEALQDY